MGLFDGLNISASGLTANSLWMSVTANNIANANTTRTPGGGPYRREEVVFAPVPGSFNQALTNATNATTVGGGVQVQSIVQDPSPFNLVYDPSSPDAVNGYVQTPNVNISTEMMDMVTASNAYQANVTAFNATKAMDVTAIGLGKGV